MIELTTAEVRQALLCTKVVLAEFPRLFRVMESFGLRLPDVEHLASRLEEELDAERRFQRALESVADGEEEDPR